MFRLIRSRLHATFYRKLLRSFFAIIAALILLLSIPLYLMHTASVTKLLSDADNQYLSQVSYSWAYMDYMARRFCESLMANNRLIAFMNSDATDGIEIGSASLTLNALIAASPYVQSIYVYNKKLDLYVASSPGTFSDAARFFDQEITRIIRKFVDAKQSLYSPFPRRVPVPGAYQEPPSAFSNVYTYILFDSYDPSRSNGVFVVNIDAAWLTKIIASLSQQPARPGSEMFVIDQRGVVVNHPNASMFLQDFSSQASIQRILHSDRLHDLLILDTEHGRDCVSYMKMEGAFLGSQLTFINITPYSAVFADADNLRAIMIGFSVAVLLVGLAFSLIASKRIYHPIGNLANEVRKDLSVASGADIDEVGLLHNAFQHISEKAKTLESRQHAALQMMRGDFLRDILHGNLSANALQSRCQELGITLDFGRSVAIVVLMIDRYHEFASQYGESDRRLWRFAVSNVAQEICSARFATQTVDFDADYIALLIEYNPEDQRSSSLQLALQPAIAAVQGFVLEHLHISLSAAIGPLADGLYDIPDAFEQALVISQYRMVYGHRCVLTGDVLAMNTQDRYVLPPAKEKELLHALGQGNLELASAVYFAIVADVCKCSYQAIMSFVMYLSVLIFHSANATLESRAISDFPAIGKLLNQLEGLEIMDDVNQFFLRRFEEYVAVINNRKKDKTSAVISNVMDIIAKNYRDKNLCLNTIADEFKMSPVYLGRLFKDVTGESVANYIWRTRMEVVKRLLDEDTLELQAIVDEAGLERNNYFYTAFKKYFGVSLSDYKSGSDAKQP